MTAVLRIVLIVFAVCAVPALAAPMGTDEARHLRNRAGFGARPADLAAFAWLSRDDAVERLLAVTPADPMPLPSAELAEYLPPARLRMLSGEERKEMHKRSAIALRACASAPSSVINPA